MEDRYIVNTIKQRKRKWLGHALRHDVLLKGRQNVGKTYQRKKETTTDEQHMRGNLLQVSKEAS